MGGGGINTDGSVSNFKSKNSCLEYSCQYTHVSGALFLKSIFKHFQKKKKVKDRVNVCT